MGVWNPEEGILPCPGGAGVMNGVMFELGGCEMGRKSPEKEESAISKLLG